MKNYGNEFIFSLMKAERNTGEKRRERAVMQKVVNPLGTPTGALLLFASIFFFMLMVWSLF